MKIDKKKQSQVDAWNAKNPPGTRVNVKGDDGKVTESIARSEAWIMGGHTAMIMVDGIRGGYMLDRVTSREVNCISCGAKNVEVAAHAC